ncbi:DUF2207 domain-containing protein [Devosia albogilva]|uniref:DUF2207 domain-containing protein n=1 Tax=Devosia albogilva TaxID=429726 RepID=A0ABW5QMJ2_9HYPH
MRLLRLVVVALAVLAAPVLAREEIRSLAAEVTLRPDGSVRVVETVDVNAELVEIRRGIFRDIFTTQLDDHGNKLRSDIDVISVTRAGRPETFRVERMGNFHRVWIGDPERMLSPGEHRYVITYTMTGMAREFEDHDELYWNATGHYWNFPVLESVARAVLPNGAVIEDLVAYTGPVGSTEQAVTITRVSDTEAIFRTGRALGPGEGMTFAVAFNKGVLVAPTGVDALLAWLSRLRDVWLPVLGVVAVLAYNLTAWSRVGRDPPKGTIIPLFHPPKGFSPALTHYVHHWGFSNSGWTALTAAIFDLGVKGLVRIDNPGKTLKVTATGTAPNEKLPTPEQVIYDFVESRGSFTIDKANGADIAKKRRDFVAAIEGENRQVWFRNNTGFAVLGFVIAILVLGAMVVFDVLEPEWLIAAAVIGIILGVGAGVLHSFWNGRGFGRVVPLIWLAIVGFNFIGIGLESFTSITINTAAVAAASIVLITVGFAVLMRAPTIQGRKVMDEIEGFKLYLETAEKERLNILGEPPLTVERFERILPYAIALGVEKPWSDHFEAELGRNAVPDAEGGYRPNWYRGSSFSSGRLSSAITSATTGMAAAMVAAQPVQASSSGFSGGGGGGGGFSGGGGGGGGGGGW